MMGARIAQPLPFDVCGPLPSGVTIRSCSTRSRWACRLTGMSPISSKNSVPPLACCILPMLPFLRAPVKAPSS